MTSFRAQLRHWSPHSIFLGQLFYSWVVGLNFQPNAFKAYLKFRHPLNSLIGTPNFTFYRYIKLNIPQTCHFLCILCVHISESQLFLSNQWCKSEAFVSAFTPGSSSPTAVTTWLVLMLDAKYILTTTTFCILFPSSHYHISCAPLWLWGSFSALSCFAYQIT